MLNYHKTSHLFAVFLLYMYVINIILKVGYKYYLKYFYPTALPFVKPNILYQTIKTVTVKYYRQNIDDIQKLRYAKNDPFTFHL